MDTPLLYHQLMDQLSHWVNAKDVGHLQGVSEAVGAILQSQQGLSGPLAALSESSRLQSSWASWWFRRDAGPNSIGTESEG
jgi:hypothetical protein